MITVDVFLCSVFLIMSQATVTTTTTTTPPVTVVCSSALPITLTVVMAPTCVDLTTLGQHNVVLLPQLILRDTMGCFIGLTIML